MCLQHQNRLICFVKAYIFRSFQCLIYLSRESTAVRRSSTLPLVMGQSTGKTLLVLHRLSRGRLLMRSMIWEVPFRRSTQIFKAKMGLSRSRFYRRNLHWRTYFAAEWFLGMHSMTMSPLKSRGQYKLHQHNLQVHYHLHVLIVSD